MSLILDIILIIVMAMCIVYGYKNGFFKSIMNLISGIVSAIVAYTFTPALSVWLSEKFFLGAISKGIADAFASAAKTTTDAAGEMIYDLTKMLENPQINSILERFGANSDTVADAAGGANEATYSVIEDIAVKVATPVAETVSTAGAFILLFVGAAIVLKVFTAIISAVFKLPVLKTMDKGLGLVAGAVTAFFFGWVLSLAIEVALPPLSTVIPDIVSANTFGNTIIVKFFAENSIVDIFSKIGI